jgi:hypothetical protein
MKDRKPGRAGRPDIVRDVAQGAAAGRAAETLSAWAGAEPIRADLPPIASDSVADWHAIVDELHDLSAEIRGLRALAVEALIDIAEGCADPGERARAALAGLTDDEGEPD